MPKTVMIVDDTLNVVQLLREYLTEKGYQTVTADNGRNALYTARHARPDIILLDVMMPEMDGLQFIRSYKEEADTPIILLTAKIEEQDKVHGLELGADDYITKPFSMAELHARIRAVLRRFEKGRMSQSVLRSGELMLDMSARQVKLAEKELDLTPSEFEILSLLMHSPGRAFSRAELIEHLDDGREISEGSERTIDVHVMNVRRKIEGNPRKPQYIQTVFGVGYRFTPEGS